MTPMEHTDYRLAAVLYIDLVGFRAMMAADERASLDVLSEYNGRVTRIAGEHHGTVIKTDGDALLLDFPSTADAVRSAAAILPEIGTIGPVPGGDSDSRLRARAGLHVGDVVFRMNDALGDGVSVAAGLARVARPGAMAVSAEVFSQISARVGEIAVTDRGPVHLEPAGRDVHVHELRLADMAGEPETDVRHAAGRTAGDAGTSTDAGSRGRDGADDRMERIRRAVLAEIRRSGARPPATALDRLPDMPTFLTSAEIAAVVHAGLARPENSADADADADAYRSRRDDRHQDRDRDRDDRRRDRARDRHASSWGDDDDDLSVDRSPAGRIVRGLKRILKQPGRSDSEVAEAYRNEFRRRMKGERAGLAGHTTSYIGVNAMLVGIWFFTGAGFPWYLFPLLGWGIGYMSHRVSVGARETELAQVESIERPSRRQLQLHRQLWKVRRRFRTHVASTGMTALLLGTINVITGAGFPWALIPIGFMGIGTLTHWRAAAREESDLIEQLDASGFALSGAWRGRVGRIGSVVGNGAGGSSASGDATGDPAAEARAIRGELLRELKGMKEAQQPLGGDFRSVLDTYVSQIEALATALREVDALIAGIPIGELEHNRRQLEDQLAACTDDRLAAEYRRSIEQIDGQRQSFSELKTEREMLSLRTDTAVGALKQLKIDVVRARSSRSRAAETSLEDLRSRSTELSRYLSDLREAYEELE